MRLVIMILIVFSLFYGIGFDFVGFLVVFCLSLVRNLWVVMGSFFVMVMFVIVVLDIFLICFFYKLSLDICFNVWLLNRLRKYLFFCI